MSDDHTFEAEAREDIGDRGKVYFEVPEAVVVTTQLGVDDSVAVAVGRAAGDTEDAKQPRSSTSDGTAHPGTGGSSPPSRPTSGASGPRDDTTPQQSTGSDDPPVSTGDVLEVEIETVGDEGDGIAKIGGYTVFVPEGDIGDQLTIEVETVRENFAFATIQQGRT